MSTDAFDITTAIVASPDCPAVSTFPIITTMAEITLSNAAEGYAMNFAGRDTWPSVVPPGWDGGINHTLWICERIGGVWYILPVKEGLGNYCTLGPILTPGQVPNNLTYYAQPPMLHYQPQPGELVGFFATTGDTRRMNLQPVGFVGRTNIMLVDFEAGHYTASAEGGGGGDVTPPDPSGLTLADVMASLEEVKATQQQQLAAQRADTEQILTHITTETDRVILRLNELRQEVIDFAEVAGKVLLVAHHRNRPDEETR